MKDLELWQQLIAGDLSGVEAMLLELAEHPLRERAPFFGLVEELLEHESASLRAAAVTVFRDVSAQAGLSHVVARLDDSEATVRAAAVRALRTSAKSSGARWAHAIFHPRVDVRKLALEIEAPVGATTFAAYLRVDPDLGPQAAEVECSKLPLALVLELHLRGHAEVSEIAQAFAAAKTGELRPLLLQSYRRSDAEVKRCLIAGLGGKSPAPTEDDLLDVWCAVYWSAEAHRVGMLHALTEVTFTKRNLAERVALALLVAGEQRGHLPETLELAIACDPHVLVHEYLPRPLRRRGTLGLSRYRDNLRSLDTKLVIGALDQKLPIDDDGQLDLATACVLVNACASRRVALLCRYYGQANVLSAAAEQEGAWPYIVELPDHDGPMWFVEKLAGHDRRAHAGLVATGLPRWLAESQKNKKDKTASIPHRVLATLDSAAAIDVLSVIAERAAAAGTTLKQKSVDRLAEALGRLIPAPDGTELLMRMIPAAEKDDNAALLLQACLRDQSPGVTSTALLALETPMLERMLLLSEMRVPFRSDIEKAIAKSLLKHPSAIVASWAKERSAPVKRAASDGPSVTDGVRALKAKECDAITKAAAGDLSAALAVALRSPTTGLVEALASRAPRPNQAAVVALVGCADSLPTVSEQIERFLDETGDFRGKLLQAITDQWQTLGALPPLGHAWLHRWEKHTFALLNWIDGRKGGLAEVLRLSASLSEVVPRRILWEGFTAAVVLRRYRQNVRLKPWATSEVAELLVRQLDTDLGHCAAKMLVTFHLAGFAKEHLERLRDQVVMMMADMDRDTTHELRRWIRVDGLEARVTPARPHIGKLRADRLLEIRNSTNIGKLQSLCRAGRAAVVHEAALRLVELGGRGQRALAELLTEDIPTANRVAVADTVSMWLDRESLVVARGTAGNPDVPAQIRFRVSISLCERDETEWSVAALEAAAEPDESTWLTANDCASLIRYRGDEEEVSLRLATSVHPHGYQRAVGWLVNEGGARDVIKDALGRFLRCGTGRPLYLRRSAARRLLQLGDPTGLVVCIGHVLDAEEKAFRWLFEGVDQDTQALIIRLAVAATVLGGRDACQESRCYVLVRSPLIPVSLRDKAIRRLLTQSVDGAVREKLVTLFGSPEGRDLKLGQVADIFAWGVRRGRELTGRLFRVHMTAKREALGYTRLNESTIFVSPLPVLKGDRHGKQIVEALVLHEFGHHIYHRSRSAQQIWGKAQKEGLGSILNLVADEHLERNLRATDSAYGDRLKRLAAYAFAHSNREFEIARLLGMLMGSAFEALSEKPLDVAFHPNAVVVSGGQILRQLDRRGHGFARFVRALRMGLGNRHADPQLAKALALFEGGFRHHKMKKLYDISVELSRIYGGSADLASAFGGHESMEWDEREGSVHGDGLVDDDVQGEVERILNPRQTSDSRSPPKAGGRLQINVGAGADFKEITKVEKVPVDAQAHRSIAVEVRRHSTRLRSYLDALGLSLVPRRARLRGRSFDRTRTKAVVLRRDPRMLVARELEIHNDLFIGVVIDCSGSMVSGNSMTKAHHFGVLIAEAIKPLAGVDARFFGFTDRVIFDAGDKFGCAVTSLQPTGGNNDAAGLLYAAKAASASPRRAKLLIMISDGLPTECSVAALRGLVDQLTRRRGMLCAQVAVRPLTEVCFPHYVEIKDAELDTSVRRFGEIISGLAKRAIGR